MSRTLVHRFPTSVVLATLALMASAGCKSPAERARVLTKDQQQQIAEHVLSAAPTPKTILDVDFEGHLRLLGFDLEGEPKAGSKLTLSMYFRVDKPLTGDWKIFVHFESPGKRRQPYDHYGVGDLYPVVEWKQGQIVRDRLEIEIPADWPGGKTQILVGLYDWLAWSKASQNRRLKIEGKGKELATNDDRIVLTTIDVSGGKPGGSSAERTPRAAPTSYRALKMTTAPTIDGQLEALWESVRPTADFRQPDGRPLRAEIATRAKMAWDDQNLYVAWTTKDPDIQNRHAEHDATLWEGDVVELFLQPDDGSGHYYELQFAPNLATFDAKFTGHRQPAWQSAKDWESKVKSAVFVEGSVNGDGTDRGWMVEVAVPWSAFGLDAAPVGRTWSANLYRIDSAGTHDLQHMGAWAPVGGDFHALGDAGRIHFAGP